MRISITIMTFFVLSCQPNANQEVIVQQLSTSKSISIDEQGANNLIALPLKCITQEYPNKLNQTITGDSDLLPPHTLHPSFYGCFDWHSAVHGHWSLVRLLKQFPNINHREKALELLTSSISKDNILKEVAYFDSKENKSFERTYGWAWILKLAEEIHTWDHPSARIIEVNLQPLTDYIVESYVTFLPKLVYAIRVGEHPNTAFGLSFALDYARTVGNEAFESLIMSRSMDFFSKDSNCPMTWEPGGFDFLSPCLEEASLMSKVMPLEEYKKWLLAFLPQLSDPSYVLEVGKVSDRTDGKLVHLDGVNFSRAWCLKQIAYTDPTYRHLIDIANKHISYSLPGVIDDSYEGGHWLGSFAIYACK